MPAYSVCQTTVLALRRTAPGCIDTHQRLRAPCLPPSPLLVNGSRRPTEGGDAADGKDEDGDGECVEDERAGRVSPSSPFPSGAQKQRRILPATVIFTSAASCQRASQMRMCMRMRKRSAGGSPWPPPRLADIPARMNAGPHLDLPPPTPLQLAPEFRGPIDCSVLISRSSFFHSPDSTRRAVPQLRQCAPTLPCSQDARSYAGGSRGRERAQSYRAVGQ
ncbi:hypothetical protein DFH08DRAFT_1017823 [Mycena albidolilacea]|uniref:Uncharacterized protein n=1 Tax=Mycena albidolilacea TaxID=1033008 RepID=A0AAD7EMR7_9AGAR|nr:hypothetical protein DFH08DRAFT_1017823 [Mycena albidolilacea]